MFKDIIKKFACFFVFIMINIRTKIVRSNMYAAVKHIARLQFYPTVIIDVGAAGGTLPLLNMFPESEYIWIEPLVEFEEKLRKLADKFRGNYIIAAAGKSSGKSIINVHSDLYGSSLYQESDGREADGTSREIDIIMLDALIVRYNLCKHILLKIDVQGSELDVLDGAQQLLQYCEVVILEVSFFRFFRDNPEFCDVIDYMRKRNFVVYDMFDGRNRPLDEALAQKDVLFVKENSSFRQTHRWATDEQRRAILEGRKLISKRVV